MDSSILVIERDRWVRHLLLVMFRHLGPVILTATRKEALEAMADSVFDVAVTDFDLASLSYDWIDELVARDLPTVVITAHGDPDELARINRAAHVFGRPFNPVTVRHCVEGLLANRS